MQIFIDCVAFTGSCFGYLTNTNGLDPQSNKAHFIAIDVQPSDTFCHVTRKLQTQLNSLRIVGDSNNNFQNTFNNGNFRYHIPSRNSNTDTPITHSVSIHEDKVSLLNCQINNYDVLTIKPTSTPLYVLSCITSHPSTDKIVSRSICIIVFIYFFPFFSLCFTLLLPLLIMYYYAWKYFILLCILCMTIYQYPMYHEDVTHPCHAMVRTISRWRGAHTFQRILHTEYVTYHDKSRAIDKIQTTWQGLFASSTTTTTALQWDYVTIGNEITNLLTQKLTLYDLPPKLQCTMYYYGISIDQNMYNDPERIGVIFTSISTDSKAMLTNIKWSKVINDITNTISLGNTVLRDHFKGLLLGGEDSDTAVRAKQKEEIKLIHDEAREIENVFRNAL